MVQSMFYPMPYLTESRKTKTKLITFANVNKSKQPKEPIITQSKHIF